MENVTTTVSAIIKFFSGLQIKCSKKRMILSFDVSLDLAIHSFTSLVNVFSSFANDQSTFITLKSLKHTVNESCKTKSLLNASLAHWLTRLTIFFICKNIQIPMIFSHITMVASHRFIPKIQYSSPLSMQFFDICIRPTYMSFLFFSYFSTLFSLLCSCSPYLCATAPIEHPTYKVKCTWWFFFLNIFCIRSTFSTYALCYNAISDFTERKKTENEKEKV